MMRQLTNEQQSISRIDKRISTMQQSTSDQVVSMMMQQSTNRKQNNAMAVAVLTTDCVIGEARLIGFGQFG